MGGGMAEWLKIECTLPDKPEIDRLADLLGIDPDTVVGKLIRFWIWSHRSSKDGNLNVPAPSIDSRFNCPGFSEALLEVGWLARRSSGFAVPRFARHFGQSALARALTAGRVRRLRNAPTVTSALQPAPNIDNIEGCKIEKVVQIDHVDFAFEELLERVIASSKRLKPSTKPERKLVAQAAQLAVGGVISQGRLESAVAAVANSKNVRRPLALFRTVLRDELKQEGKDLDALLAQTKIPAALYREWDKQECAGGVKR